MTNNIELPISGELFATSWTENGVRRCGYCGAVLPLGDSPCTCPDWGKSIQRIRIERLRAERIKAAESDPRNAFNRPIAVLTKGVDGLTTIINWLNHFLGNR